MKNRLVPFSILTALVIAVSSYEAGAQTTVSVSGPKNVRMCDAFSGTTAGAKITACIADLPLTGGTADARGLEGAQTISADPFSGVNKPITLLLGHATYSSSVSIRIPTDSHIIGIGRNSKIVSASASAPTAELIRLQGENASISNVRLSGSGQVANHVDQRRAIWIGCGTNQNITCITRHNRVENVFIDQFVGNGIAGDFTYAQILHNTIENTTDSGIFLQPSCSNNLIQGNTIVGTRYSGIDNAGSSNRIIGNHIANNGGGNLDPASQSGILVAYVGDNQVLHGVNNIIEGNTLSGNMGCGVLVNGMGSTSGIVNAPYGNIIRGNVSAGHTHYTPGYTSQWMGGFCTIGGNNNIVANNVSSGNTFNYVMASTVVSNSTGNQLIGNQSLNAATNAGLAGAGLPSGVGYFFPGSGRLDGVGGHPVDNLILKDNYDKRAALDSYRIGLTGANVAGNTWNGWVISGNRFESPGAYGFNLESPNSFVTYHFDGNSNYGTGAGRGSIAGFGALGLAANSKAPSVANASMVVTQNTTPTRIANFTNGLFNQEITVFVGDSNTTFDFTSSNLKGYEEADVIAANGDFMKCLYNGRDWYCDVGHLGSVAHSVTQTTSKSTPVMLNFKSGNIRMDGAALGANTSVMFTFNNSVMGADDHIHITVLGGRNAEAYTVKASNNSAGAVLVTLTNNSGSSLSDAVILGYTIEKQ
jgi:parallel beta-helix repeat protein